MKASDSKTETERKIISKYLQKRAFNEVTGKKKYVAYAIIVEQGFTSNNSHIDNLFFFKIVHHFQLMLKTEVFAVVIIIDKVFIYIS